MEDAKRKRKRKTRMVKKKINKGKKERNERNK